MKVNRVHRLFQGLLFFLFLKSLNAWFTWNLGNSFMLLYPIISAIFFVVYRQHFLFRKYAVVIFFYLVAMLAMDLGGILGYFCANIPICLFIATKNEFKLATLRILTKWWLYILIPSLVLFWLSFFVSLPSFGTVQNDYSDAYKYTNYILLIKGAFYNIRFNSIFLEPGHLGMIVSFFLYAYRFDLSRWEVWALLTVELFTLSLAGYVLVALGYTFSLLAERKNIIKLALSVLSVVSITYFTAISYNGGNNLANQLIFERLAYDEEKGVAGNNRFGQYADDLVERKISSGDIWTGTERELWQGEFLGAGWKVFFIKYGVLPMIVFLVFYYSFSFQAKDKRFIYLFMLLFILAFLQRAYPYWASWNIPFIAAIGVRELELKLRTKKLNPKASLSIV